jgi:Dullard-like phosphatase family protein
LPDDKVPSFLLPPPAKVKSKPTLVLDLDETLVRAFEQDEEPVLECPMPTSRIVVEGYNIWVAVRPGASQFLSVLSDHFELVVWTAGIEEYGRAVVHLLDPTGKLIRHSLFRQHCIRGPDGYIKDLSLLGRDKRTRICDNNPVSFSLQPEAGILVEDFYGDPQDSFLKTLLPRLIRMVLVSDFAMTFTCTTKPSLCGESFVSIGTGPVLRRKMEADPNRDQEVVKEFVTAPKTVKTRPKRSPRYKASSQLPLRRSERLAAKTQPVAEARTRSSRARGSTREPLRRSERLAEKALLKKWYVPF